MTNKIDLLVCRFTSYDQNSFTEEALAYSENSIIYFTDFDKIILKHKPDDIKGIPSVIHYPVPKNKKLYLLFFLFFWAPLQIIILLILFLYIALRFRPKIIWTDNTLVGALWAIFRRLIGCACFIYDNRDWIALDSKQSFFSWVANNVVWPRLDYLATVSSDLQINYTEKIRLMRNQFFGKEVTQNLVLYNSPFPIKIAKEAEGGHKTNICFVGQIREDSGLELLIPLLPKLYETHGIKLKIFGPTIKHQRKPHKDKITAFVKNGGFEKYVHFYEWIDSEEKFHNSIKDCFCGVSLFTNESSYSAMAIPGKILVYLQMAIPLVATQGNGVFTEIIEKYRLGFLVSPNSDEIMDSIINLYNQQTFFSTNIRNYAKKHKGKTATDYINLALKTKKRGAVEQDRS